MPMLWPFWSTDNTVQAFSGKLCPDEEAYDEEACHSRGPLLFDQEYDTSNTRDDCSQSSIPVIEHKDNITYLQSPFAKRDVRQIKSDGNTFAKDSVVLDIDKICKEKYAKPENEIAKHDCAGSVNYHSDPQTLLTRKIDRGELQVVHSVIETNVIDKETFLDNVLTERKKLSGYVYITNKGYTTHDGYYIPVRDEILNDRYRDLHTSLGKGSFSIVIKAIDTVTSEYVAIKVGRCCSDPMFKKSIIEESIILKMLYKNNCYGILPVLDEFVFNGHYCLVMPYVPKTLKSIIINKTLDLSRSKLIAYQLIMIVNQLLKARLIHCDIKPDNILVDKDYKIYLIDFGLCRMLGRDLGYYTQTRWYRAPEIILNMNSELYNSKVDVWSCGCVIFELFTGEVLFKGRPSEKSLYSIEQLLCITDTLGDIRQDILEICAKISTSHLLHYYRYDICRQKYVYIYDSEHRKHTLEERIDITQYDTNTKTELKNLLRRLLDCNPISRIKPIDALDMPLFTGTVEKLIDALF